MKGKGNAPKNDVKKVKALPPKQSCTATSKVEKLEGLSERRLKQYSVAKKGSLDDV